MEIDAGLTSPFPRSETLVRATRDLDRGRTTPSAVEAAFREAEEHVAARERELGFATTTAGFLRSDDPFRGFATSWDGFAVGPLARWLESNTFYRQPILLHPPARRPGAFRASLPEPLRRDPPSARVILPGPYTFAELLDNRSGETAPALVHRLGRLFAEEIRELTAAGFRTFVLSDPMLVVRPPQGPAAASVEEAYRSMRSAAPEATIVLWTYGGDATPSFPLLDRLPVSAVGVDLTEIEVDRLPEGGEGRGLGLGVVDPRTTLVEAPEEIAQVVRSALGRRRTERLWLGPGAPLEWLPAEAAERKLDALAAAAGQLSGRSGP